MQDIWGYISTFIDSNKDKCHMMMTCKELSLCDFYFDEMVLVANIIGCRWFNRCRNVMVISDLMDLPSFVTHLTLGDDICYEFDLQIPSSVTHLQVNYWYNNMKNKIPFSVTHLVIYYNIDYENLFFPGSITHLTLYNAYNINIKKISQSIKEVKIYDDELSIDDMCSQIPKDQWDYNVTNADEAYRWFWLTMKKK